MRSLAKLKAYQKVHFWESVKGNTQIFWLKTQNTNPSPKNRKHI